VSLPVSRGWISGRRIAERTTAVRSADSIGQPLRSDRDHRHGSADRRRTCHKPEPESNAMRPRSWTAWSVLLVLLAPAVSSAQRVIELPARDRALREAPADVSRVGTDEGESWETFASVSQLAFDRNDNLYVLDQGNFACSCSTRTATSSGNSANRAADPASASSLHRSAC